MEESGGTIHALVEERLKLVSWTHMLDTSEDLGRELQQDAMNFRDTDEIMRHAREIIRNSDPDYMSDNEKKEARPKVSTKDPTTKTNPQGRGLGTETKKKMDEQAVAREKLEALGSTKVVDDKKVPEDPKSPRDYSPKSDAQSTGRRSAGVQVGGQHYHPSNLVTPRIDMGKAVR